MFLRIPLFQDVIQSHYVSLCHLQRLILRQLPVLSQLRKKRPQSIERLIQILHSPPLPSIGRQPPFSKDNRSHSTLGPSLRFRTRGLVTLFTKTIITRSRHRTPIIGNGLWRSTQKVSVTVLFDV